MNQEYLIENGIDVSGGVEILGDMDMYIEMLGDFLNEMNDRIPKMEQYKNDKDMDNYAIIVHAIKGDSKYLGFTKLADLALNHQLKSQEGDFNYVNENYEELVTEINRIVNVVKTFLNVK